MSGRHTRKNLTVINQTMSKKRFTIYISTINVAKNCIVPLRTQQSTGKVSELSIFVKVQEIKTKISS